MGFNPAEPRGTGGMWGAGGPAGAAKPPPKAAKKPAPKKDAQQRTALQHQIAADRSKIHTLEQQLAASKAKAPRTAAKPKPGTPAKAGPNKSSAKKPTTRKTATRKPSASPAAIRSQIAGLRQEIHTDQAELKKLK